MTVLLRGETLASSHPAWSISLPTPDEGLYLS